MRRLLRWRRHAEQERTGPWWATITCGCEARPELHSLSIRTTAGAELGPWLVMADVAHQVARRVPDVQFAVGSAEFIVTPEIEFETPYRAIVQVDVRRVALVEIGTA